MNRSPDPALSPGAQRIGDPLWTTPLLTALSLLIAIAVSFIGSGAFGGTPVQQVAGGYLSADATLLAPAGPAFSIWSVVYTGLAVYGIYQLTAPGRRSGWGAKLRVPAMISALLNAAWISVVQLGWLGFSVIVIFALVAVLAWMIRLMSSGTPGSRTEYWVIWLTFGLYLGWVCVASIANVAAWLLSLGVGEGARWAPATAVALVVVAALMAMAISYYAGNAFAALAISWGLAWIGVSRLAGSNPSEIVGYASLGCALAALLGSLLIAWRRRTAAGAGVGVGGRIS